MTFPTLPRRTDLPRYINGKFACQHTTGVQRTAIGLLTAIDQVLGDRSADERGRWAVMCPPGARLPALRHIRVVELPGLGRSLSLWEQLRLPFATRDGWLVNLSGSAPALGRQQACVIHDAAVFDRPRAYTPLFRLWYRTLFRLLARRARLLLTVSRFSRERLEAHLRLRADSFHVVCNGADHLLGIQADGEALARFGVSEGRYVLAVGSDNPNKNLAMLEQAVRRLFDRTGIRLVLVGGINHRVFAADPHAEDAVDSDIVRRLGPIDDAALKRLYEGALALVFPSFYEGFGLPPLEAMSCGCPVIASDRAAIPEICGGAAAYFDPDSPAQLETLLARLVEDPSWRRSLAEAGSRHFRGFRWQDSARRLMHLMDAAEGRVSAPEAAPSPTAEAGPLPPEEATGTARWSLPPFDRP